MMEQNNTSKADTHAANSRPEIELRPGFAQELSQLLLHPSGKDLRHHIIELHVKYIAQEADKLAKQQLKDAEYFIGEEIDKGIPDELAWRTVLGQMIYGDYPIDKGDSHGARV